MHDEARQEMRRLLGMYTVPEIPTVLDVGSYDVNGSYRSDVEVRGWRYVGVDIRPGPNVDFVMEDSAVLPFEEASFDIVISGSTLEHVDRPWLLVPEMVRVLKPDGMLAIITHWQYPYHPYPRDTFRYLPDGLQILFDDTGRLRDYDINLVNPTDVRAVGWKTSGPYVGKKRLVKERSKV